MKKNFSDDYKEIQEAWDKFVFLENKIKDLIDKHDLMLFFKKDGEIYGTNEEGRLAYATMMDKKEDKNIKKELRFSAYNLTQSITDEPKQYVFTFQDLKKIKKNIISQEKAEEELSKQKS